MVTCLNRRLRINDPRGLTEIAGEVHDQILDTAGITYACEARVLQIPVARELLNQATLLRKGWLVRTWRVPLFAAYVRFHGVLRYEVLDPSAIGLYEIDTIRWEEAKSRFLVLSCEDLRITVEVAQFDVELECTDAKAGHRDVRYILGLVEHSPARGLTIHGLNWDAPARGLPKETLPDRGGGR